MTSVLKISPDLSLPIDAVTETFAILAVKRAGKSNAAVVMAEEMYDAGVPWVAIDPKGDWWGVRAAGDGQAPGLSVLVFGGLHGDVPLEPTAGRLVADLIAEQRITCVLDVSEMSKADQRRFLTDFADRLYRRNTEPLHVFCEEADEYIPQRVMGEAAKLVGAFETLVKRGGFRGIGVTLITQRSASLNKDVLTQAGTLIAMRTPSPQDRKAVLAWIDYHAASRDVIDELPTLDAGEAWVFSPQWLSVLTRIRFRRRRTFDSGATPKVGGKPKPPATLADVDLAAIKEAMAETIEKQKADDPRELRKRIAELERHRCPPVTVVEPERVEVSVLTDDDRRRIENFIDVWNDANERSVDIVNTLRDALARASQTPVTGRPRTREAGERHPEPQPVRTALAAPTRATEKPGGSSRPAGDGPLGKGETVILSAIVQYPDGVTREQLTVLTGYKRSSRDTYIQRLRSAGLVTTSGTRITATNAAIDTLGDAYEPLPTGAALRDYWLNRLSGGEQAILSTLINAYPSSVDRDSLSDSTGYKRSSRDTYLQRLRARQLVTTDGDPRAADVLFDQHPSASPADTTVRS